VSGPLVPRMRRSVTAGAFLDGVNAASLSFMTVVTWQLARATLIDPTSALLLAVGLILLARFRFNSMWLVLGAGLVGFLVRGFRLL
jgi:chromate transporter